MRDQRHRIWVGRTIRRTRRSLRLTQADLAQAVTQRLTRDDEAVAQSTISKWESGTHDISLRFEFALADALGVRAEILFDLPPEGWQPPKDDTQKAAA